MGAMAKKGAVGLRRVMRQLKRDARKCKNCRIMWHRKREMITITEFELLTDAVTDDDLDSCVGALIEAQRRYECTPRPPKALDRASAVLYVINRASHVSFGLEDAYYVFIWPLLCLSHRNDNVKMKVMEMIHHTIDRAETGTRPVDEKEYVAAQSAAFEILESYTPDRIDGKVEL